MEDKNYFDRNRRSRRTTQTADQYASGRNRRAAEEEMRREARMERKAENERKKYIRRLRLILLLVMAAGILMIVIGIFGARKERIRVAAEKERLTTEAIARLTDHIPSDLVAHFSFSHLLADDSAAGSSSALTVDGFREILQDLYDNDYVLVDIYDVAQISRDGASLTYSPVLVDVPAGKKPFVLSERDVSYPLSDTGAGYASKLIIDSEGNVSCQYRSGDGSVVTGAFDVVPVLEDFISKHPDFSVNGARGVLALTGYNGILGYRTTEFLGKTAEEGNPYAENYGTFNVAEERRNVLEVIKALKKKGWRFACDTFSFTSYGVELDMVRADAETWEIEVGSLIGDTDILFLPKSTDIGSWSGYPTGNEKYAYLRDRGFSWSCIQNNEEFSWLQIRKDYVRQGIHEIETYDDYKSIMNKA